MNVEAAITMWKLKGHTIRHGNASDHKEAFFVMQRKSGAMVYVYYNRKSSEFTKCKTYGATFNNGTLTEEELMEMF